MPLICLLVAGAVGAAVLYLRGLRKRSAPPTELPDIPPSHGVQAEKPPHLQTTLTPRRTVIRQDSPDSSEDETWPGQPG